MQYCDGCKSLSPTEKEQHKTNLSSAHMCFKFKMQVKHLGHHPYICRLDICLKENGFIAENKSVI